MPRPPSIILFERLYLGSLVVFLLGTAAFWSRTQAIAQEKIAAMPQAQANSAIGSIMTGTMAGTVVLVAAVSVLFWWLVARQRSAVGKWLVVATEVLGALSALSAIFTLVRGTNPNPPGAIVQLVATLLAIAAAVLLFRPDTRPWFGEDAGVGPDRTY